jgi:hypothetical protein
MSVQLRAKVELPSFMTFDFTPEEGPHLSIRPYQKPAQKAPMIDSPGIEAVKIVGRNTILGAVAGASVGALCFTVGFGVRCATQFFFPSPLEDEPSNDSNQTTTVIGAGTILGMYSLVKLALGGGAVGGAIGAARGARIASKYYLDCPPVMHAMQPSHKKAQEIIRIFVNSQLKKLNRVDDDDIECPISRDTMVYPVDVNCGSKVPHTFDYFTILKWLERVPRCPTCNGAVNIGNLSRNLDKERKIHKIAGDIFEKMEAILQNLPKRFCDRDGLPNFFDSQNITTLAEMVKNGGTFLSGDIRAIREKIDNPDTLSLEETFALGHFLVHQFKPLKHKIDQIYQILTTKLIEMRTEEKIDGEALATQLSQVQKWYENFDIIPQDCKIVRKLYQI